MLRGSALVPREALFDRLSDDRSGAVVLICAPAGSGKTVLVRSWIEATGPAERVGWVSVERHERDAQRFCLAVIDALAEAVGIVQPVDPSPQFRGAAILDQLLRDLGALDEPAVLVVDDLHELESSEALHWLEAFLTGVPRELRVVLLSRETPRLSLHRLRLAGQLTELGGADLDFSMEETEDLLRAVGIALAGDSVAALHQRTEGWAAGLRLAAISLAHRPDPERFVTEFSGSERTVAGYLLAEVLEHQPAEVRELLLRTSLLERVSGPLADSLTGMHGSERILQELEDANAFVTSLDVGRSWFRYHHLFADLLQLELRRVAPDTIAPLHRAAAEWLEAHGDPVEAIRHAQAAHDWAHSARLLSERHIGLILDGRLGTVRALLDACPADQGSADPELALAFADVRLRDGLAEEAVMYTAAAERQASAVPEERRPLFELQLAGVKLEAAGRRGDLVGAREAMCSLETALGAQNAGELKRSNDIRALALMTLGTTELWSLALEDARRHLEEALSLARRIGRPYLEIGCLADLGVTAPLSGLSAAEALRFTEEAATLAELHGLGTDPIAALSYAIGGGSLAWLGRFEEAEEWLERAEQAVRAEESPGTELALHHARGLLRSGQARLEEALAAFRAAENMQAVLAGEHALAIDLRMRIPLTQVRMGDLAAARAALASIPEAERDRSDALMPAAALELAEDRPERALELLAPVIDRSARTLHPTWAAIHALLFEAAAREQLGETRAVEAAIERALELAEPEGLILPFTITPVQGLLERHARGSTAHPTLLAETLDVLGGVTPKPRGGPALPVEELSEAELRVVRYLPTNLKAPEIAAELFVSTNTVRTHLRHIYAKLGAHGRAEAVARARELRLLGPTSRPR